MLISMSNSIRFRDAIFCAGLALIMASGDFNENFSKKFHKQQKSQEQRNLSCSGKRTAVEKEAISPQLHNCSQRPSC